MAIYVFECRLWLAVDAAAIATSQGLENVPFPSFKASAASILTTERSERENVFLVHGGLDPTDGGGGGGLFELRLPRDYCHLFRSNAHKCLGTPGCSHCSVYRDAAAGGNSSFCYSSSLLKPDECSNLLAGVLEFNDGQACEATAGSLGQRGCEQHKSCAHCLSSPLPGGNVTCRWCSGCSRGRCVSAGVGDGDGNACPVEYLCPLKPEEMDHLDECPEMSCVGASDCDKCGRRRHRRGQTSRKQETSKREMEDEEEEEEGEECVWTRQVLPLGEQTVKVNHLAHGFDWLCEKKSILLRVNATKTVTAVAARAKMRQKKRGKKQRKKQKSKSSVAASPSPPSHSSSCPVRCHEHTDCNSCLTSSGGEGGFSSCRWSAKLERCLSPAYASLQCPAAGLLCGKLLQDVRHCPLECGQLQQCKLCLSRTECGWCALEVEGRNTADSSRLSGLGVCVEGSPEGPLKEAKCRAVASNFSRNGDGGDYSRRQESGVWAKLSKPLSAAPVQKYSWHFFRCPAENECSNGHHTCDPTSELCVDLPDAFRCDCKAGYTRQGSVCRPVCSRPCVHGACLAPDVCQCDFSYVGLTCDTACQCNGHSDCAGPNLLNVCLLCHNNTVGKQCEFCRRGYVGHARDGGHCRTCEDFCNGHSSHCFASEMLHRNLITPVTTLRLSEETIGLLENQMLHKGLDDESDKVHCVNCAHHTMGEKCQRCQDGYYSQPGQASRHEACAKCYCNGHSARCNRFTGEQCQCRDNTVSYTTHCNKRQSPYEHLYASRPDQLRFCHQDQCNKCKEYFLGLPWNGHQCYRQMTVNSEYCFNMQTLALGDCAHDAAAATTNELTKTRRPVSLAPGQAAFFAVQPKFMNVDIRVMLDVAVGTVNVLLTSDPEMFVMEDMEEENLDTFGQDGPDMRPRAIWIDPRLHSQVHPAFFDGDVLDGYENHERDLDFFSDILRPGEDGLEGVSPFVESSVDESEDEDVGGNSDDADVATWNTNRRPRRSYKTSKGTKRGKVSVDDDDDDDDGSPKTRSIPFYALKADKNKLSTFVTLQQPEAALSVRNLSQRLVVTLPQKTQDLRSTRFYLIVQATSSASVQVGGPPVEGKGPNALGSVFFRQDQYHIDLFVFFSVFFSLFFMFMSFCILAFKFHVMMIARRIRQMTQIEMQNMARRPFATQFVLLDKLEPLEERPEGPKARQDLLQRHNQNLQRQLSEENWATSAVDGAGLAAGGHSKRRPLLPTLARQRGNTVADRPPVAMVASPATSAVSAPLLSPAPASTSRTSSMSHLRPIAVEATHDRVAAVATVLVRVPNGGQNRHTLCFGCVLANNKTSNNSSNNNNTTAADAKPLGGN